MAAGDLTTLDAVRQWLNLTTALPDELLTRLISAASAFIQGPEGLGYQVAEQDYVLVLDGRGGDILALGSKPPLTAVASLKVDGVDIPPGAAASDRGYHFSPSAVWLTGYRFTAGRSNVELHCTRGWAAVPAALEQLCIELVGLVYKGKEHIGQESAGLKGETVTFSRDLPEPLRRQLLAWKQVVPQ